MRLAQRLSLPLAPLVLASLIGRADAQDFLEQYLGAAGGAAHCYARAYTRQHLQDHPDQRVTVFTLRQSDAPEAATPGTYGVQIAFRLRNAADTYGSEAECTATGRGAACLVEADGGSFTLQPSDGALMLRVERLEVEGETSFSPNLADSDDRVFRLYRSAARECELSSGDRAPLPVR